MEKIGSYMGGNKKLFMIISAFLVIVLLCAVIFPFMQYLGSHPQVPSQQQQLAEDISGTGQGGVEDQQEKPIAEIISEKVEQCVAGNPSLTEEQCWDLKYHGMAIAKNNQSLCEKIKSEQVKEHCERYFK